ncbi:hypothetical protein NA56DRAFT_369102 [Hyaloscypha hepaticicola]|uniref:2EXR domain-containing protein n=1 Tax=Hyaloscypha hepaticicola TaxID=2082293 RepID=A0A2J6PKT7_9HELO|nr:hypothetical protein NA56DRAFT_369102 [Hyaloscypha hepaticicola]
MHEHVPSSSRVLRPRAARAPAPYPKNSTTKTLTKFTCFDKLPFELREMVWKFALPGPRTITVSKTDKSVPQVKTNAKGILPTPLMHTCHESRQLALQRYKPAFSVFLEGNKDIYFDWERDCLCSREYSSSDISAVFFTPLALISGLSQNSGSTGRRSCIT